MSKLKKNEFEKSDCLCSSYQGFFISHRHMSLCISILLFLCGFIFIAGFFLGKKQRVQEYMHHMSKNMRNDDVIEPIIQVAIDTQCELHNPNIAAQACEQDITSQLQEPIAHQNDVVDDKKYYAELIGFATEKAAEQFVIKIIKKGVPVEMKKRISKTARGRKTVWYQVITSVYEGKQELQKMLDFIVQEEKLKDVRIRTC